MQTAKEIIPLDITSEIPLTGISLVEASAGTGKTYSIAKLFLQVILSGVDIREILVVTFTESATKELRGRIREEIYKLEKYLTAREAKPDKTAPVDEYDRISAIFADCPVEKQLELIHNALLNVDLAAINTIHGFCQRMLVENAFESRIAFGSELLTDTSELIEEIARNFWRKNFIDISELEKEVMKKIDIGTLTGMAKQFLSYRDVKLTNNSPLKLQEVKSSLYDTEQKIKRAVDSYGLEKLEEDLVSYYEAIAGNMNKPFGTKYYEKTIADCIDDLRAENYGAGNMGAFNRDEVAATISKSALNRGFELPDAEFFKIGRDIAKLAELKKYLKCAIFEELFHYVHKEFEEIKNRRHILTFDDLIFKLYEVIRDESAGGAERPLTELIRGKFRIALVDEFQDTDRHQYYIFNEVFGKSPKHGFFMIGDPKQSIYKFRGADIFSYLKAKRDAEFEYTLLRNYRSEASVIEAVNSVFEFKKTLCGDVTQEGDEESGPAGGSGVFVYSDSSESGEGIPFNPASPGNIEIRQLITETMPSQALQMVVVDDSKKGYIELKSEVALANEIVQLLTESSRGLAYFQTGERRANVTPGDIAVLVNTHKQAAAVKKSLNKAAVPAVIQNSAVIFHSEEAQDIKLWLKALQKPIEKNIRPLFVTNILRKSFSEIDSSASEDIILVTEELMLLQEQWQDTGFFAAFRSFMERFQTLEKVLNLPNGERVITNYFQLADLLHQYELRCGRNIEKILSYLQTEIEHPSSDEAFIEQLETDKNSVRIMTLHKSKGLEFPIVFCPYFWENEVTAHERFYETLLVNERKDDGTVVQMLDLKADEKLFQERLIERRTEVLAEHIRLLYVALTRATNRIYLYLGNEKSLGGSALTYLFTAKTTDFLMTLPPTKGRGSDKYYELCLKNIAEFAEKYSEFVSLKHTPGYVKPQKYCSQTDEKNTEFHIKQLKKRISQAWGVGSFSGLIANAEYHGEPIRKGDGAFGLPSGKKFGTAIHAIFENYYKKGETFFTDGNSRRYLFEDVLKTERYFKNSDANIAKERFGIVEAMMKAALNANIAVDGISFKLKDVKPDDAKPEFSFYHRVKELSPTLLQNIFANFATGRMKDFSEEIPPLDFILKKGYMYGEIDLFFRYDNRYFVLDWKTNHLGAEFADYAPEKIEENMYKHYYLLQAHIYSLAAHLFLKQNLAGYDYDKNFGGFIYVYTRGVDADGNGIYCSKPPQKLIEKMEEDIC